MSKIHKRVDSEDYKSIVMAKKTGPIVNFLLKDWGIVDGKLVYLPLWDPLPNFLSKGFITLLCASALRDASKLVTAKALAQKLELKGKEYVSLSAKQHLAAWEEGDPICPPFPFRPPFKRPFPPFPWPPTPTPGPDPSPELSTIADLSDLPVSVKSGLAGYTLVRLGETFKDKALMQLGEEVLMSK